MILKNILREENVVYECGMMVVEKTGANMTFLGREG